MKLHTVCNCFFNVDWASWSSTCDDPPHQNALSITDCSIWVSQSCTITAHLVELKNASEMYRWLKLTHLLIATLITRRLTHTMKQVNKTACRTCEEVYQISQWTLIPTVIMCNKLVCMIYHYDNMCSSLNSEYLLKFVGLTHNIEEPPAKEVNNSIITDLSVITAKWM